MENGKRALGDNPEEIKHEKKQNRKIDISLYFSVAALLVAIIQVIISTPFFTEYYYQAKFEVIENEPTILNRSYTTNYTISNTSENNVNNVEVGIQTLKGDVVQILPNPNIQVNYTDNGPMLKNCSFSIGKLIPNESIVVMVHSNLDTMLYYHHLLSASAVQAKNMAGKATVDNGNQETGVFRFPSITMAKFDKGFAVIKKQPRQKVADIE